MKADFLQHFTNFGNILNNMVGKMKSKEEIQGREEQPKPSFDDGSEAMQDIMMLKMASDLSDDVVLKEYENPELVPTDHTAQFQSNQHSIKKALDAYISIHGKMPTSTTLARMTGLSRPTIHSHMKEGLLNVRFKDELAKLKLLSTDLFAKLYQLAQKGDKQAIKMIMDIILGSGQKLQTNTQNNYIQVNNIRVDNQVWGKLSFKAQKRIERIIRKELQIEN
jgi:hypothetical protein